VRNTHNYEVRIFVKRIKFCLKISLRTFASDTLKFPRDSVTRRTILFYINVTVSMFMAYLVKYSDKHIAAKLSGCFYSMYIRERTEMVVSIIYSW
jgi:hypothetical protein